MVGAYVTEVRLVHLDLFEFRGFVSCMDLVLFFLVPLTVQTLRNGGNKSVTR